MTFESFLKNGLYLRNWSKRTAKTYSQAWSSYQRFQQSSQGDTAAGVPSKAQLESWVIWMRESGVTPGGCNMYIRSMNSFITWLNEQAEEQSTSSHQQLSPGESQTKRTPIQRLRLLPNPVKPLKGFSEIEIRSLLSFRTSSKFELRTFTLVQTLLDTGTRIDEVLTLQTENVDLDNLVLRVHGKGDKTRLVPVSFELRKVLFRYLNSVPGKDVKGFVFSTRDGHKLSYRNTFRDIKNLCAKAGVSGSHVHPHSFRHHFSVTYIRRGGDIYRLSRILGHTSVSTTQLYLRSMGIEQIGENHSFLSPLSRR